MDKKISQFLHSIRLSKVGIFVGILILIMPNWKVRVIGMMVLLLSMLIYFGHHDLNP